MSLFISHFLPRFVFRVLVSNSTLLCLNAELHLLHFRSCSPCLWEIDADVIQTHVVGRSKAHAQCPFFGDGDKSHSMMPRPVGKGHLLTLTVVHNVKVVLRVTLWDIWELFKWLPWILIA